MILLHKIPKDHRVLHGEAKAYAYSFPEMQPKPVVQPVGTPTVYGEYEDKYKINGKEYTLQVKLEGGGSDLFWVDVSKEAENIIIATSIQAMSSSSILASPTRRPSPC